MKKSRTEVVAFVRGCVDEPGTGNSAAPLGIMMHFDTMVLTKGEISEEPETVAERICLSDISREGGEQCV